MSNAPPLPEICYFQKKGSGEILQLGGEHPARWVTPAPVHRIDEIDLRYLRDAPVALSASDAREQSLIEVFVEGQWVTGLRHRKPTEFKFEVSVISFAQEREAWAALEDAVHKAKDRRSSDGPLTWVKITPPSRRVLDGLTYDARAVIQKFVDLAPESSILRQIGKQWLEAFEKASQGGELQWHEKSYRNIVNRR